MRIIPGILPRISPEILLGIALGIPSKITIGISPGIPLIIPSKALTWILIKILPGIYRRNSFKIFSKYSTRVFFFKKYTKNSLRNFMIQFIQNFTIPSRIPFPEFSPRIPPEILPNTSLVGTYSQKEEEIL